MVQRIPQRFGPKDGADVESSFEYLNATISALFPMLSQTRLMDSNVYSKNCKQVCFITPSLPQFGVTIKNIVSTLNHA